MRIADTYDDIVKLIDDMNSEFDFDLWDAYINKISKSIGDETKKESLSYDFNKQILPVLKQAMKSNKLKELHESFLYATDNLEQKLKQYFGETVDADIILYMGLCNGAGTATVIEGRNTILLGIEKIIELNWHDSRSMTALIYHELGHIWHNVFGKFHQNTDTPGQKAILQLYQEGIAMYFEQVICNDFSFYHQDKNGWLNWCNENKEKLLSEFIKRIESNTSVQEFFGDWTSYLGHSDTGYFLGCEIVKALVENYTLKEIANMDICCFYKEMKKLAL